MAQCLCGCTRSAPTSCAHFVSVVGSGPEVPTLSAWRFWGRHMPSKPGQTPSVRRRSRKSKSSRGVGVGQRDLSPSPVRDDKVPFQEVERIADLEVGGLVGVIALRERGNQCFFHPEHGV